MPDILRNVTAVQCLCLRVRVQHLRPHSLNLSQGLSLLQRLAEVQRLHCSCAVVYAVSRRGDLRMLGGRRLLGRLVRRGHPAWNLRRAVRVLRLRHNQE